LMSKLITPWVEEEMASTSRIKKAGRHVSQNEGLIFEETAFAGRGFLEDQTFILADVPSRFLDAASRCHLFFHPRCNQLAHQLILQRASG